jgi:hypothetical protein
VVVARTQEVVVVASVVIKLVVLGEVAPVSIPGVLVVVELLLVVEEEIPLVEEVVEEEENREEKEVVDEITPEVSPSVHCVSIHRENNSTFIEDTETNVIDSYNCVYL